MPGLLDSFKKHAQEVYGTLSDNERIKDRAKYGDLVKQGFLQSFPMLDKQPQDVTMDDLLASGIGAMPLTFGGRMAAHAPIDDINKAVKEAEERGLFGFKVGSDDWMKANKEIHKKTGIHFGADNMPRFEMDDSLAGGVTLKEGANKGKLGEYFTHDEVYSNYPDVKDIDYHRHAKGSGGGYTPRINEAYGELIRTNNAASKEALDSTTLHEIQHALQTREGFAGGGSPEDAGATLANILSADLVKMNDEYQNLIFKKEIHLISKNELKRLSFLEKTRDKILNNIKKIDDFDAYRKLAGEAEARAVQQRIPLNKAQRAASFPLESYDVPIDELIVRKKGKSLMASMKEIKDAPIIKEMSENYRGVHEAPTKDYGAPLSDLTQMYPDDIYSKNGARYYGDGTQLDNKAIELYKKLRNKPDELVEIYRAVPKGVENAAFYHGDWVTPIKEYAMEHGYRQFDDNYTLLTTKVPVKSLFTDANSLFEFGLDANEGLIKSLSEAKK